MLCPICKNINGDKKYVSWNFYNKNEKNLIENDWYYIQCSVCQCAYLEQMKNWTSKQYSEYIYNNDYSKIDAGYNGSRANSLINQINELLKKYNCKNILDYGGGKGYLTDLLNEKNFKAYSYDMFNRKDIKDDELNNESFDACVSVEVLEHELDSDKLWQTLKNIIKFNGYLFCTTEYLDGHDLSNWMYTNPRAGHNLIYSKKSFAYCAIKNGFLYLDDVGPWHILQKF